MAQRDGQQEVARIALMSIPVAIVIMAIKFLAWQVSGSVALLSDALESIINVVAAVIAFSAVRIAQIPPDEDHPFGHHKAEYFASVVEGVLIVLAALLILSEAVPALFAPSPIEAALPALAISAGAAVANALWSRRLTAAGARHRSAALTADGAHVMADVLTSLGVIAGLILVYLTGWTILDPLMAVLIALNILRTGWGLIRSSTYVLMDGAVEEAEATALSATITSAAHGAEEVHDLRLRRVGPALFIEFHLVVDGEMSVTQSHAICDRIEAALETEAPGAHVSIHVEPSFKAEARALKLGRDQSR